MTSKAIPMPTSTWQTLFPALCNNKKYERKKLNEKKVVKNIKITLMV